LAAPAPVLPSGTRPAGRPFEHGRHGARGDLGDASLDYPPQAGFDMSESGDEEAVTIPTVIGAPPIELDPYDYYSSPESKADAEARKYAKVAMQKPQDGTPSSDEDDSSDEDEVPPPPKKPSKSKRAAVVESSADEETTTLKPQVYRGMRKPAGQPAPAQSTPKPPAQSTPKPPVKATPKVSATPKAASSSSDSDSDSDDMVEVPVPEPKKKDKRKPAPVPESSSDEPVPPPKTSSAKKSKKTVDEDEDEIPEHLKPKKPIRASGTKPKPGSDTEEEVMVLSKPDAKKKRVSKTSVKALNAYEKTKDYSVRVRYGPSGRMENLTGLSGTMKDAIYVARNMILPVELYTKDSGVFPDNDMQVVVCGTAFALAVAESVENDRFRKVRKRFQNKKEGDFFRAITAFCAIRLTQARGKPADIARSIIMFLFGLEQYSGNPKALKKAVLALLRHGAFIHDGEFREGDDRSITWHMDANQKKKQYVCKALIQLIAMAWMGKSKALKTKKKEKSLAGYDWAPKVFPNATYVREAPEPGEPLPKEIPVPMMAYAATSLEFSLKEWDRGTYRFSALEPANLSDIYDDHVKALKGMKPRTRSLMLQYVYREARAWTPPHTVIEISSDSEKEDVQTDEAVGLYA
ncbi:hypothetical protein PENSPDRAFT_695354, partial [Peniophora sp. CONT]